MAGRFGSLRLLQTMKGVASGKRGLAVVLEREAAKRASGAGMDHNLDGISGLRIGGPQNLTEQTFAQNLTRHYYSTPAAQRSNQGASGASVEAEREGGGETAGPSGSKGAVLGAIESNRPATHDMAMLFTCKVCQTRSFKTMSKASYTKGVVLVRCPGCQNLHLMADNLGWFGKPGSVESFLAERGDRVRKGVEGDYEFTPEDLEGWSSAKDQEKAGHEIGGEEGESR